jgi:hypothetical protein
LKGNQSSNRQVKIEFNNYKIFELNLQAVQNIKKKLQVMMIQVEEVAFFQKNLRVNCDHKKHLEFNDFH